MLRLRTVLSQTMLFARGQRTAQTCWATWAIRVVKGDRHFSSNLTKISVVDYYETRGVVNVAYSDGQTYEGKFVGGKKHGKGKITYADGRCLIGEFKRDKIHNGKGVVIDNGVVYEGHWVGGKIHGLGKCTYPDGRCWEGEFRNGKMYTGTGVFICNKSKEEEIDEEEDEKGEKDDSLIGMIYKRTGDVYEGEWLEGLMHGQGVYTYATGQVLKGEFRGGRIYNGTGTMVTKKGMVYAGRWVECRWDDMGTIVYFNDDIYSGQWANGLKHGQGTLTYVDGRTLQGHWKEGKICNGTGLKKFADGGSFEGTWVNGKRHGKGKVTYADGRTLEGLFKNGKIHNGVGVLILPCGTELEGKWVNGKMPPQRHGQQKQQPIVQKSRWKDSDLGLLEGEWMDGE